MEITADFLHPMSKRYSFDEQIILILTSKDIDFMSK